VSEPTKSGSIFRRGNNAALILVVITVIELILALTFESAILLVLLSIAKAGIIIQVFMNISRLWNPEDH